MSDTLTRAVAAQFTGEDPFDLPQQLRQSKVLHPRVGTRGSPIKAVILTGAEIDQITGLLSLRERESFAIYGTPATLAALAGNAMFGVLAPDVVKRQAVAPGTPVTLPGGLQAELFTVPGKAPLYLEGENPQTAVETDANVGVELSAGRGEPGGVSAIWSKRAAICSGVHIVMRRAPPPRPGSRAPPGRGPARAGRAAGASRSPCGPSSPAPP